MTSRTSSCSSASAIRSMCDLDSMFVKSALAGQLLNGSSTRAGNKQSQYPPYRASRSSRSHWAMLSSVGLKKQMHLRCGSRSTPRLLGG